MSKIRTFKDGHRYKKGDTVYRWGNPGRLIRCKVKQRITGKDEEMSDKELWEDSGKTFIYTLEGHNQLQCENELYATPEEAFAHVEILDFD